LEKEAVVKGYVDMYGQVSSFKPRKRRYEQLAELLKVSTPLGECHRPTMLGDCQSRYACLSCDYHRVTFEELWRLALPKIAPVRQECVKSCLTHRAVDLATGNKIINELIIELRLL
jgi:hypothetical protein